MQFLAGDIRARGVDTRLGLILILIDRRVFGMGGDRRRRVREKIIPGAVSPADKGVFGRIRSGLFRGVSCIGRLFAQLGKFIVEDSAVGVQPGDVNAFFNSPVEVDFPYGGITYILVCRIRLISVSTAYVRRGDHRVDRSRIAAVTTSEVRCCHRITLAPRPGSQLLIVREFFGVGAVTAVLRVVIAVFFFHSCIPREHRA